MQKIDRASFTWIVTNTVHRDRKNIFSLGPTHQHHVGTLISGSATKIDQFTADLRMIESAPLMLDLLKRADAFFRDHAYLQSVHARDVSAQIRAVLSDIGSSN